MLLTRQEVEWILDGKYEFLLRSSYRLCREFYIECVCNYDASMRSQIMKEKSVDHGYRNSNGLLADMNHHAAVGSYDIFDSSLPTMSGT